MLSGGLFGSALACRFGVGLGTRAIAVSVFAGCARSLAGLALAAATAGCFGLDVAGLVFDAECRPTNLSCHAMSRLSGRNRVETNTENGWMVPMITPLPPLIGRR